MILYCTEPIHFQIIFSNFLNISFLYPLLIKKNQITEVDYGTFLNMVESKEVSRVELNGDSIYFVDTDKEEPKYYATTTFDDPELVNRLEDAGCEFGRVAEKEMNPILNFLLVWIVPILIFWGLGQLLSNYMMKKMGGGGEGNPFMSFQTFSSYSTSACPVL